MNLEGILSIAGKPGLFKLISQAKNTIVVESLIDKKRIPLYASHQVSALEDIGIYTYSDTVPLSDIFDANDLIKLIIPVLGGKGGGGRNTLAQGGGSIPENSEKALKILIEEIERKLAS